MDMQSREKVAAIVVTYNRKELLKECIDALLAQDYKNCDIHVIDNASTDGTGEFIDNYIQSGLIFYHNTGANLGGAGGFNYGMKKAYETGCDYMWLMDDDCIVGTDSLTKLMEAGGAIGRYGFLSSKVLWKDDTICNMNVQKVSLRKTVSDWETDRQKIIMATFVSFLVPTEIVKEVGYPIREFFIWADDIEYSRRISRKYDGYLITASVVHHKSKTNIGSNIAVDSAENLGRYRYAYRNEAYVYRREGLYGYLYYKAKIAVHKRRVRKTQDPQELKDKKLQVITEAAAEGKGFYPSIEYAEKN